jgi:NAD(P)-dependent dehydrogenase (short-subunit alcohol dehydrogenase family)
MTNIVIITGANGEIGFCTAGKLSDEGYSVFAVSRVDQNDRFNSIIRDCPIENTVISDLGDATAISDLLAGFDLLKVQSINLVYSAAVFERVSDFRNVTPEVWDRALSVNLKNAYLWNQKIAEFSIANKKKCSIVNITSQAWMTGGYGEVIAYAASKGGLVSMTKALARVVASSGVRVNCIAPGFIETKSMRGTLTDKEMQEFLNHVPMRRLGAVEDVSNAIEFLISAKSAYITGATIAVTGGQLMH